jgi:CHAT domain-containing protein/tetratricopeptide (TPR) repeat protein
MRVQPTSFMSAISVVALFLVAPSHRGNAEQLPQSTQEGPSTAPMDVADATKRIALLSQRSDYYAAVELAGQLAEAIKARLGTRHADYARIIYNLADLLTAAGRRTEAVARYREAIAIFEELAAADPSNFEWPRYLIGAHERIIKAGDQPGAHTEKALAIVKRLRSQGRLEPWEKDWPAELELKLRGIALEKLVGAGKLADALTMSERRATQVQLSAAAKRTSPSDIAAAFGEVAWLALLARRPATALAASERAIALAPDHIWLATNYAHALLFLGRRAAAKAVYLRHKGEDLSDRGKWEAVIGADFAELREHGIVDKQMGAIERALGIVDNPIVVVQRVQVLRAEGRYADALSLIERRTQTLRMQSGEQSLIYAKALDSMAAYAYSWGPASRRAEWVAAQRQAIDLFKRFLPRDDPRTAEAKRRLASFYYGARDHDAESEALLREVLDTCDRMSRTNPSALDCLRQATAQLSRLYTDAGRDEDDAQLQRWAIAAAERKWGLDHPYVVPFLELFPVEHGLAFSQIRERDERIASILGKAVQADPPDIDYASHASIFRGQFKALVDRYEKAGQKLEAERALKFLVQKFGDRQATMHLIDLQIDRGQGDEAKAAIKALVDKSESEPVITPYAAKDLVDLYIKAARLYGDDPEAASYRQRAFTTYEHLVIDSEPDWVQAARYLSALADLYVDQRRFDRAAAALQRAIQFRQNAWSTYSPQLSDLRDSLARVYKSEGKDVVLASSNDGAADKGEARKCGAGELDVISLLEHWQSRKSEMLARCSVEDWRALNDFANPVYPRWSGDPVRAEELSGIAYAYYGHQDWANALALYARAADLLRHTAGRNDVDPMLARSESWRRSDEPAEFYVRSAYGLAQQESSRAKELADGSFAMAQQAVGSVAASALVQMNFRRTKNEPRLAELLRERQSLVDDRRKLDKALADAVLTSADRRDLNAEEGEWAQMGAADARIGDVDKALAERFPEYAALAQSPPLGIARTQELLRPDEALVLFLEAPDFRGFAVDEAFVWVVTKTDFRWVRIERRPTLRGMPLDAKVAFLRCGLDSSNWVVGSQAYERCKALRKAAPRQDEASCPSADEYPGVRCFDTTYAFELYQTLFGQVEDLIKDKHLLIVPSNSLTELPFYVLVTEKPEPSGVRNPIYADTKWLVDRQSVAILPSVGSLAVLRRMQPTRARRALIGFGDPLLDGRPDDPAQARRASEARARQRCAPIARQGLLEWMALQDIPLVGSLFRGRFADVEVLRRQMPLPETTDELCAVARRLGAPDSDILLGRRMTEAAVKTLSAEGRLRDYRILHFATHGLVAGDLANVAEPALMFSPPETATELDDGLLTASEVAQLDLDADWVVLSACNTAAGASKSAQALSGLARAFFYAGARALLVSHWAVNSPAAVAITTGAFDAQSADPTIGRAEALRRSIRSLIANGGVDAYPAVWAPFILVGDGT